MKDHKVNKSQEGSAYWHYIFNKGGHTEDGAPKEFPDANPDQLSEDDILIKKSVLSEADEDRLALYYRLVDSGILKKLPEMQRKVWKLRFFKWFSEEDIATKLGISLSAVRSHLARAASKIRFAVEKKQKQQDRLDGNYFHSGLKKGVHTIGSSSTDKEFAERLEKAEKEIDEFCKQHPELKRNV